MLITSEAVGAGHPDKICDQIADSILDNFIKQDPESRVACEVFAANKIIYLAGEVTSNAKFDAIKIAWNVLFKYGYDKKDFEIYSLIHKQSMEINNIVDKQDGDIGAGDQGIMFGYATNETKNFMPLSYVLAQELLKEIEKLRVAHKLPWVKSDMKSQITLDYTKEQVRIHTIVLSIQHSADFIYEQFKQNIIEKVISPLIKKYNLNSDYILKLNSNGSFILGGPAADTGLTGRKIIVDTYGAHSHHGGGSFSGKDYTKVDRSAAYAARWIAKNIVAAKIADQCEVQLAYIFGDPNPVSIHVETFNTSKISNEKLITIIKKVFKLKVSDIINNFDMKKIKYSPLSIYGHFGRDEFNYKWENTNMVNSLKEYI